MRRWRMVLAGAALVVPTFLGAAPVHADETNAACRRLSNLVRQLVHESSDENVNREFNRVRNEVCKTLHM
jgi:hypothetical protein